jgi:hypothetical protein
LKLLRRCVRMAEHVGPLVETGHSGAR